MNLQPRLANQALYSKSYGRAVSIVTAGNAGAWTALPLRPKFIRDIASLVFSIYYLATPDHAEEKSRKFNYNTSISHIRAAFEIMKNPYLAFFAKAKRPKIKSVKYFMIPRPKDSIYVRPIKASLWYDKPIEQLQNETKMILHIHGGGFVTMDAELHADSLIAWAQQTKVPIIAIDYHLAPEYPFPYALDECYEAYVSIMQSLGLCVGLSGTVEPDIVITGDSAGGNISAAVIVKIIMRNQANPELRPIKKPVAAVLTYPALDLGPAGVCGKLEMDLIRQQAADDGNNTLLEKKEQIVDTYYSGIQPVPLKALVKPGTVYEDHDDRHPLTLSSRILFFQDGILAAPALYCMVLLYTGTDRGSTDFKTDPLMSPLWAHESILAEFPKTYITCGDIDPLVDDSVMFTSRLRNARREFYPETEFTNNEIVEINLVTAVSHGFLQFQDVFPEARNLYKEIGSYFLDAFENAANEAKLNKPQVPVQVDEFLDRSIHRDPFRPNRHLF